MEKIVGTIISKTTGIHYQVKWNVEAHESWIKKRGLWQLVCTKIFSADDAISCAQHFIDGQPDLF